MVDLKRIDDIEWRDEIRYEASKWLDSMKSLNDEERLKTWMPFNKNGDVVGSMNSIEAWIKHFFNLD
ncbi:MAG: hypothetical protein ACE5ES_04840 [Candidatus Nanoarchaeia archaeon]